MIVTKAPPIMVPCWNCGHLNAPFVLPEVRLMRCPSKKCKAELPGVSQLEYAQDRMKDKLPARIRGTVDEPGYGW